MDIAHEIQFQIAGLSKEIQVEILNFIKFIKYQRKTVKPPAPLFPPTRLEDVAGCLNYQGEAKSVEEMDAAITAQFRREWRR